MLPLRLAPSPALRITLKCRIPTRPSPITVPGTQFNIFQRHRRMPIRTHRRGSLLRARPAVARQQSPMQPPNTQADLQSPAAGYTVRQPQPPQPSQQQYPPMQPRQGGRPPQEGNPQNMQQPNRQRGPQRGPYESSEQAQGPRGNGGRSMQGWGPQPGQANQTRPPVDANAGKLVLQVISTLNPFDWIGRSLGRRQRHLEVSMGN
jgi:hypothetical protein